MNTYESMTSEEYVEEGENGLYVDDASEALDRSASGNRETGTATLESEDDIADHGTVSSEEPAADETDVVAPEHGTEGVASLPGEDQELELVEGYDESLLEMERAEAQPDDKKLLDAWYAEFGDPAIAAMLQQQPELAQTLSEVVIGTDDRVKIGNTTLYPWRCICSLLITAKDGSRWIGTGWLVGPRTLITAGHVVYMHSRGGWVREIEVIPGRNGSSRPYGSCKATSFRSVKGWTVNKRRSHDYGAIVLPRDCAFGTRLGYFGYANLSFFSLLGLKVNLSGYPGDKPAGTQWWHARRITFVTTRTLVYNIDTFGGQSGSPVWRLRNGKRHVVGIHTNGSTSGNSATRITKPVFDNIKKWKAEGA
jgi:glutamyl endopeptidase